MGRLVATTLAALLLSAMGGVQEPATRTEANTPQGVRVFNTRSVKEPKNATAELVDLHASDHMVTRVMRLAPGATIKEHCHPFFDETFFVHAGSLKMVLDDTEHELRSGDTVIMPAGTIIAGTNTGSEEAVVVIVWANIGKKGPLFVHGRPDQQKKEKR
ncbi:MAG: cupin domain-containing protein [Isosphaeraceae bacterium]